MIDFWLAGLKTLGFKQFLWRVLVSCWQHECHFDSGLFMCDTSSPSLSPSPLLPPLLASLSTHTSKPFLSSLPDDDLASYFPERMKGIKTECIHSLSLWINSLHLFLSFFASWYSHYACVTPFVIIPQFFYHFHSFFFPLCFQFGSFY